MILMLKIAAGVAALYLAVVVFMALLQDRLLFPRWAMRPGAPLPPMAERLAVPVGSGDRLVGVHLLPEDRQGDGMRLILGFGGNAWNANDLALHLQSVFPGHDIVAFHYRGYLPSTGRPAAQAILDDALAIHDHVGAALSPASVTVVGLSLGAGPAAHLARSRLVDGLVLVTPFDSLAALAREHYPLLPVRLLLRHRLDVAGDVAEGTAPVAVIAAGNDSVVPPERTVAVRRAARNLVVDRVIADAGHNDIYSHPGYRRVMQTSVALIEADSNRR